MKDIDRFENIGLVRKIAWSFHRSTGIEMDELVSEGLLQYCEGLKHYDPSQSKITTFMWMWLHNSLINYVKVQAKQQHPSIDDMKPVINKSAKTHSSFFEYLSQDAQMMVNIILRSSSAFVHLNSAEAQQRLITLFRMRSWATARIQHALNELITASQGGGEAITTTVRAEVKKQIRLNLKTQPAL